MAGITLKATVPEVAKALKAEMSDAAMEAANNTAQRIKNKGRAMIRGSYRNMGGMANAFRVTVFPQGGKKSYKPAILASVNTPETTGKRRFAFGEGGKSVTGKSFSSGYSAVFERSEAGNVSRPIVGKMWLPFPDAKKLMGRKRLQPKDWSRSAIKFAKMGDTVVAFANVGLRTRTTKKFRSAAAPRQIRRRKNTDPNIWVPMWFLVTRVDIAPQWELRKLVEQEWATYGNEFLSILRRRSN